MKQATLVALGDIGPDAKEAVPFLCDLLKEGEDRRHWFLFAAKSLGQIGPDAKAAIPLLIAGNDPRRWHPENYKSILCQICQALGGIGPDAKDGVPLLLAALKDDSATVREYAAAGLKRVDPEAAKKAGVK